MFQRDYFMRMIEQMTEAVGQILNLRRERKHEDALLFIDELLDNKFRLSSKLIRSLSDEDLIQMMTTNGVLETDHLQAIAMLMKQDAEINADLGREDESFFAYLKALHLSVRLVLAEAEATFADPREMVRELMEKLLPYELPPKSKRLLIEWHMEEGRFDSAENLMYELLEDHILSQAEAEALYRRMLLQADERLEAGGLPREEIKQGLAELIDK
ncbi:DUF6483 family protein [Paenibacillus sinopodophylli]|uniref:DUF6483 family protein n=1 Tax=Paenibacillus sinopodophylli TaxID=1837342 RepID=UPI00110CF290|nr:DUF6483 family protein [Paenibacillus sinopodophylli]